MYHRIYFHVVWTTRSRELSIDLRVARFLDRFLRAVAEQERALVLEIGLVQTHVHLLVRVHPAVQVPRLLQRMKGGSANVASREGHAATGSGLRWAKGYSIVSVGLASLPVARQYVRGQASRHPTLLIPGWEVPPSVGGGVEGEWISEKRTGLRAGRGNPRRRE